MPRSIFLAILAFSLLILTNLAVFGYLIFADLSEKMVTENLMAGIQEVQRLANQQEGRRIMGTSYPAQFPRQIVSSLKKYRYFRAILLVDRNNRVLYREEIHVSVFAPQRVPEAALSARPHNRDVQMIPIQDPGAPYPGEPRMAVEYNAEVIEQEVKALRRELNRKMTFAIVISLALLSVGLGYVVLAFRRGRALQHRANRADRMAYVGTLASGLAHEIRNPLNSMNMNVQLIQEELLERRSHDIEDIGEMLEATRKEILRLERLVSSFLAFARPTRLQTTDCQINDLVADTLDFLWPEIEKSKVQLKTQFDARLPDIAVDESQLRQALINIIHNAIQVLRPEKLLEVSTRRLSGDGIAIKIRDEGPGISQQELQNIFKVFYSTRKGGTGLGLPIAQHIIELHDGTIEVESEVGIGTTVTLKLPRRASAA